VSTAWSLIWRDTLPTGWSLQAHLPGRPVHRAHARHLDTEIADSVFLAEAREEDDTWVQLYERLLRQDGRVRLDRLPGDAARVLDNDAAAQLAVIYAEDCDCARHLLKDGLAQFALAADGDPPSGLVVFD